MKLITAGVILLAAILMLLAVRLHDDARRYDVVMAGAGSGGSQSDSGSAEILGYLVDHKTGRVWLLAGQNKLSTICFGKEKEPGCETAEPAPTRK